MFKSIYVKTKQEEGMGTYRMVAVFDEAFAQSIGIDDTDYSQLDNLIETLETDEEVLIIMSLTLHEVLPVVERPTTRVEGITVLER